MHAHCPIAWVKPVCPLFALTSCGHVGRRPRSEPDHVGQGFKFSRSGRFERRVCFRPTSFLPRAAKQNITARVSGFMECASLHSLLMPANFATLLHFST